MDHYWTTNNNTKVFSLANHTPWFLSNPARADRYPVPTDKWVANPCSFRLSYGAAGSGDSLSPYPATYLGNTSILTDQGSNCTDGGTAFDRSDNSLEALAQIAHERIAFIANLAATNISFGSWAYRNPQNTDQLRTYVFNDPTQWVCAGYAGRFVYSTEDICLNFSHSAFHAKRTPAHEFGHYLHGSYGLTEDNDMCDKKATKEGYADAVAVLGEWWRVGPVASDALFTSDLGSGIARTHTSVVGVIAPTTPSTGYALAQNHLGCGGENYYAKGMMISQMLWKFLNNRYCTSFTGGPGANQCVPATLITSIATQAEWVKLASQTLTFAIDDAGASIDVAYLLKTWFERYSTVLPQSQYWRLRQAFLQHETPLTNANPVGYHDAGSTNAVSGWACDTNTPYESTEVHIYISDAIGQLRGIEAISAGNASEPAVAAACGDVNNRPHRFHYVIPSWARDVVGTGWRYAYAFGIDSDYTDGNHNTLLSGSPQLVYIP